MKAPVAGLGLPVATACLLLLALLAGCAAPIQVPEPGPEQTALPPRDSSAFAPVAQALNARHGEDQSGFLLLDDNRSGLEWRLRLIDSARHSIDLQYYLWYGDTTGRLIAHRVIAAAERGVRVRLLIDDLNTLLANAPTLAKKDRVAAWLDAHPNVELRLFNPWSRRRLGGRLGESLAEVERVNQRMHNKALIVDNLAVILGGRNLGDEYMGLNPAFNFRDLDVLGVGPVARQASAVFDGYWNSTWVMPAGALDIDISADEWREGYARLREALVQAKALEYIPVEPGDWSQQLAALGEQLLPGTSRLASDMPTASGIERVMLKETRSLIRSSQQRLQIVNAYVIPAEETITTLGILHDNGVDTALLTNSLASHDVPAVNSHYKSWRKPLIEAGVDLYELRHDGATQTTLADTPPVQSQFMGLHSKAMVVDGRTVYIGSMNYDPRSAAINTEMGVFIDSRPLAAELSKIIARDIQPDNSWQVELSQDGKLIWRSSAGVVHRQPARSWWQRVEDVFFMLFPKDLY
jgi:putative cardiolipin synthase